MADSRPITDYRPSCDINSAIMNKYGIKDNNQFRKYLQNNGKAILAELAGQNSPDLCKECPVCKESVTFGETAPK